MRAYPIELVERVMIFRASNTSVETAKKFGISSGTVSKWTRIYGRHYGIKIREKKCSDSDLVLMQSLRDDGMTLKEIGEKFDVSKNFVMKKTKRASDLMSGTAFIDAIKSESMPTKTTRIMIKNKIVGTFVPE